MVTVTNSGADTLPEQGADNVQWRALLKRGDSALTSSCTARCVWASELSQLLKDPSEHWNPRQCTYYMVLTDQPVYQLPAVYLGIKF